MVLEEAPSRGFTVWDSFLLRGVYSRASQPWLCSESPDEHIQYICFSGLFNTSRPRSSFIILVRARRGL